VVNRKVLLEHVRVVHEKFHVGEIDHSLFRGVLENLLKCWRTERDMTEGEPYVIDVGLHSVHG
jgi:hypothetical protein